MELNNNNKKMAIEFVARVIKQGGSLVIIIPNNIVKIFNINEGDIVKANLEKLPSLIKASELNKQENKEENGMDKDNE